MRLDVYNEIKRCVTRGTIFSNDSSSGKKIFKHIYIYAMNTGINARDHKFIIFQLQFSNDVFEFRAAIDSLFFYFLFMDANFGHSLLRFCSFLNSFSF